VISLLIPTRGRSSDLVALIASVRATAPIGSVEMVFRVDDDDPPSALTLAMLDPDRVVVGPRGRGYADLPAFFNAMAAVARGDLLMCGNDDMRFETIGWPALLEAAAAAYPDGLVNLGVATMNDAVMPFSCVPRAVVDRLGYLNDTRLLWSDVFLRDVFEAINRAHLVPAVHVRHLRDRRPDATRIDAAAIEQATITPAYWALHHRCVDDAVDALGLRRTFRREVRYA